MLDSGAYTAMSKGKKVDIDAYAEYVKQNSDIFDYAINLDSIGNAKKSYENWVYLRKKGVNVIPVFHIGTDERYLERYCKKTDYIMLGAIASMASRLRKISLDRIWKKYLLDSEGLPTHRVHGLGLTVNDIVLRYPWYSVDSARMALTAGNGMIFLPTISFQNGQPVFNYEKLFSIKISNQSNTTVKQFDSFVRLPKGIRDIYNTLFEENGYKLGEISYIHQQEKAKKHLRRKKDISELFDLRKGDVEEKTLTNNYNTRFLWNLHINQEIQRRLPSWHRTVKPRHLSIESLDLEDATLIFNVVASPAFIEMARGHNLLISYAYVSDKNIELIRKNKNYINHES